MQPIDRLGAADQVSLRDVAAQRSEHAPVGIQLDALGDGLDVEPAGEGDHAGNDVLLARAGGDAADEPTVDLQPVDVHVVQHRERRCPGAEVVDRDGHARVAERTDGVAASLGFEGDRSLGDLELEALGGQADVGQPGEHAGREPAVLQVAGRHVDGNTDRVVVELERVLGGLAQDELRQRSDQLGVLGQADEVAGRHVAEHRVLPPDQRLDHGRVLGGERHLRLVLHRQLLTLDLQTLALLGQHCLDSSLNMLTRPRSRPERVLWNSSTPLR